MNQNLKSGLDLALVYDLRDDYLAQGFTPEEAAEFDSISTIDALEKALRALGHRVHRVGNGHRLAAQLVGGRRWDLVFNIAEGLRGRSREAQVPCLLEMYDIPYTFSDPLVCAVTLDKGVSKRLIRQAGLNTPDFEVVSSPRDACRVKLEFPLFVKPVAEGTSKGIDGRSKVNDPKSLYEACSDLLGRYDQPVLVEEYLPGREFTTGIVGSGCSARTLGTMEIKIGAHSSTPDYSFEVKQDWEKLVEYRPLHEEALRVEVEKLAIAAYKALECRDAGRVDIRLDSRGLPSFVEINPLPGLNPVYSDLPILGRLVGWSYDRLIGAIIESACSRVFAEAHTG